MPKAKANSVAQPAIQANRSLLVGMILLFVVALVPRCLGLTWGLPSTEHLGSYHPDEFQMGGAVNMLHRQGDFNPRFFNYPSLYIYLVYFVHSIAIWLHVTTSEPNNVEWFHDILLSGRVITAVLGAATAPVVYGITRYIAGARAAVVAGLLMAFLPGHVQHSHFATVDVAATFFGAFTVFLALRGLRGARDKQANFGRCLYAAAVVAGLATATKYNLALVILAPLTAACLSASDEAPLRKIVHCARLVAFMIGGFLLGCPYSVLDFPRFWGDDKTEGVYFELFVHPRIGQGEIFSETGNGWLFHLFYNLPFVLTWPVLALSGIGLLWVLLERRRPGAADKELATGQATLSRWGVAVLLLWPAVYFLSVGTSQVRFMRYMLPLAPTFCVLAALGLLALTRWGADINIMGRVVLYPFTAWENARLRVAAGAWGAMLGAALGGLLAWPVMRPFVVEDPRDQAARFMRAQTTPTTVGFIDPPWFYSPPLSPEFMIGRPIPATSFDGRFGFSVLGPSAADPTANMLAKLRSEHPRWLVLNEFEWRDRERLRQPLFRDFMAEVKHSYALRGSFRSRPGVGEVPHDYLYSSPEIRVFERRRDAPT